MDEERLNSKDREYSNGEIIVYWKPDKCIHATTCYRELIDVFNPRKRPWVNMNGGTTDEIIRVVEMCPTDALTFKRIKESKPVEDSARIIAGENVQETPPAEIRVMKDGPLIVKGNFIIRDSDNKETRKMKMATFCRCGHSGNMPFCDGTHRKIGFSSD